MNLLKVMFNGAMAIFGLAVMFTIFQLIFTMFESFKVQNTKKGKKNKFKITGFDDLEFYFKKKVDKSLVADIPKDDDTKLHWEMKKAAVKALRLHKQTLSKLGLTGPKNKKKRKRKLKKIKKQIEQNPKTHGIPFEYWNIATSLAKMPPDSEYQGAITAAINKRQGGGTKMGASGKNFVFENEECVPFNESSKKNDIKYKNSCSPDSTPSCWPSRSRDEKACYTGNPMTEETRKISNFKQDSRGLIK